MKKTLTKRTVISVSVAVSAILISSRYGFEDACALTLSTRRPSFHPPYSIPLRWSPSSLRMVDSSNSDDNEENADEGPAGTFFHKVPPSSNESDTNRNDNEDGDVVADGADNFDDAVSKLLRQRRKKPLASRPSTINGVPTAKATGFGKPKKGAKSSKKTSKEKNKPYVAIGTPDQPINDPTNVETDDQGYTLYTDEQTGQKSRVFEALVDYPSVFTMKIVGANEGAFVTDVVAIVAEVCETNANEINYSTKVNGKWISVTVKAPVQNAEMLYSLYEKVDLDPRVKFKF